MAGSDVFAYGHNVSRRLMSQHHRGMDPLLRPVIPFQDVHIRSANGGAVHLDEHLIVPHLRDGKIRMIHQSPRARGLLHQTAHGRLHQNILLFAFLFLQFTGNPDARL